MRALVRASDVVGEFAWHLYDDHGQRRAVSISTWPEPIYAARDLAYTLQGALNSEGDWIALAPTQKGVKVKYELAVPVS